MRCKWRRTSASRFSIPSDVLSSWKADQFNVPNTLVYTRRIVQPDAAIKLTGQARALEHLAACPRWTSHHRPLQSPVPRQAAGGHRSTHRDFAQQSQAGIRVQRARTARRKQRTAGLDVRHVFGMYYASLQAAKSVSPTQERRAKWCALGSRDRPHGPLVRLSLRPARHPAGLSRRQRFRRAHRIRAAELCQPLHDLWQARRAVRALQRVPPDAVACGATTTSSTGAACWRVARAQQISSHFVADGPYR